MEESSSETSSEVTYEDLLEMLKWNTAAMVAILDHNGGTIKVEQDLLENIDLSRRAVQIRFDEENKLYIIESGDITDAVQ